jgi:hypothetical protein
MWQRYVPLHKLFGDGETRVDVFFSQGTWFPQEVYDEWGFVACMGTAAFRATQRTRELLTAAMKLCVRSECDDQLAMNHALLDVFHVKWNRATGVGRGLPGVGVGAGAWPTAAQLTVRVWPKPFVFRSAMEDVKNMSDAGSTGEILRLRGGPDGTCLGQIINSGGGSIAKTLEQEFSTPFIVSPRIDKKGGLKMAAWEMFNKFCFVIGNKKFLQTRLPAAAAKDIVYTTT